MVFPCYSHSDMVQGTNATERFWTMGSRISIVGRWELGVSIAGRSEVGVSSGACVLGNTKLRVRQGNNACAHQLHCHLMNYAGGAGNRKSLKARSVPRSSKYYPTKAMRPDTPSFQNICIGIIESQ